MVCALSEVLSLPILRSVEVISVRNLCLTATVKVKEIIKWISRYQAIDITAGLICRSQVAGRGLQVIVSPIQKVA